MLVTINFIILNRSKLLDPNFNYFIIQEKSYDGTDADIEDQDHNIVGKIKEEGIISIHLLLFDSENSQILKSDKKMWSFKNYYEVIDLEGKILGIVKEKFHLSGGFEIRMLNSNKDIILICKGPYDKQYYEIRDGKKN